MNKKFFCWLLLTTSAALLVGCVTTPQTLCPACSRQVLNPDSQYPLIAYTHNRNPANPIVHVYLEGDGIPWIDGGRKPAANPTSRSYTALQLMQLDKSPGLYLNRPCYGYKIMPHNCTARLWTSARYSQTVVEAMDSALDVYQQNNPGRKLVLIGHSGGGTLAMLIAAQRTDVLAVVTLAANLDHKAWTDTMQYHPLEHSLNAVDISLSNNVLRWHFAGNADTQVPAALTEKAAANDDNAEFILEEGFGHTCCWQLIWPEVLTRLRSTLAHQPEVL